MKTDREQLELAAKAAGYVVDEHITNGAWVYVNGSALNGDGEPMIFPWRPRVDDGDALRLAMHLKIDLDFNLQSGVVWATDGNEDGLCELYKTSADLQAATRLAIFRASVAIGEAL